VAPTAAEWYRSDWRSASVPHTNSTRPKATYNKHCPNHRTGVHSTDSKNSYVDNVICKNPTCYGTNKYRYNHDNKNNAAIRRGFAESLIREYARILGSSGNYLY